MSDLAYHVVDVFTDRPYAGNPLAVVLGAEGLSTGQLLALAREFNLSETAFPLFGGAGEADYELRICTPVAELPFAGHPSVGTAWLLYSLGLVQAGRVVQRCGAGLLPLLVSPSRVELTGGTPSAGAPLDAAHLAALVAAAGLGPGDLGPGAPRVCSTGLPFAFVEVAPDAVARAEPDQAALRAAARDGVSALAVFAWDAATRTSHARVFGDDVLEDPATGSAAAAFGAWLAAGGLVPADGETAYVVTQGAEIGRPSRLDGVVVTRGGAAVECRVAGGVVPVASGTIRVP